MWNKQESFCIVNLPLLYTLVTRMASRLCFRTTYLFSQINNEMQIEVSSILCRMVNKSKPIIATLLIGIHKSYLKW